MAEQASEKILDRVRALLAVAEHPGTGEHEAETALNMANSLMTKYAIDEALARADMTESERRAPVDHKFAFASGTGYHEFLPYLRSILVDIAKTFRCKAVLWHTDVQLFGMEQDVAWVEMLYTSIYFQFLNKINPRWDTAKGYDENVYNFKVAGRKWLDINKQAIEHGERDTRIWETMHGWGDHLPYWVNESRNVVVLEDGAGVDWEQPTEKMTAVLKNAYKRHAAKIGDTNQVTAVSHTMYRREFAEGFQTNLLRRLSAMRDENEDLEKGSGAEVVLYDQAQEIKNAMYAQHPDLRPEAAVERAAQAREARDKMLNEMTPKQRYDFLEKERKDSERWARRNARYWDEQARRQSQGGHRMGNKAAEGVDLTRKAGAAKAGKSAGEIS